MTWQALSEARPRTGQAVKYRLRPNGVEVRATYEPKPGAWVLDGGHQQTARAHHQWTPDPSIENRTCLGCGKPLERKIYRGKLETERQFRARQCCDQVCNGRRKRTVTAPDTKTCPRCGKRFKRGPKIGHAAFLRRKYCSHSCSTSARTPKEPQAKPRKAAAPEPVAAPAPKREAPKREIPKQPPRAPRKPQAPVKEWSETSKRSPTRGEFDPDSKPASNGGPDPRAGRHETIRMQTLGDPCPHHPSERINAWGKCPACVTGNQWAERERLVTTRPSPEGGR